MDKEKVLQLGIEVLQGVDLSKTEDITVQTGIYTDGREYTTISIEYLSKETIYADNKEVIK